jgi:hypothetical protein
MDNIMGLDKEWNIKITIKLVNLKLWKGFNYEYIL